MACNACRLRCPNPAVSRSSNWLSESRWLIFTVRRYRAISASVIFRSMEDLTKAMSCSAVSGDCAAHAQHNRTATASLRISLLAGRILGVLRILAIHLRRRRFLGLLVGQRIGCDVVLDLGL